MTNLRTGNGVARLMIGLAAASLASQVQARENGNVSFICPQLDHETGELSVRVDTGCRTGMARYKGNNLELVVDQSTAHIMVQGGIEYHPIVSPIVTADCAGATSITLTAEDVEPRIYSISYRGSMLGKRDMLQGQTVPKCLGTRETRQHSEIETIDVSRFRDWSTDIIEGWQEWRAGSVTNLLAPLIGEHPETEEGQPSLSVKIRKVRWIGIANLTRNLRREPMIGVDIERLGTLDDSISGERYFATLILENGVWKIEHLWGQILCARGKKAGQWSSQACE